MEVTVDGYNFIIEEDNANNVLLEEVGEHNSSVIKISKHFRNIFIYMKKKVFNRGVHRGAKVDMGLKWIFSTCKISEKPLAPGLDLTLNWFRYFTLKFMF